MITKKELDYVNLWANKVPFPGEIYCYDVADKLKKSINLYNNEYLKKKYNISFSNNEEIEFEILEKNLCHMLGIDYKNLSGDFFKNFRKNILGIETDGILSYDLLNNIADNIDKVIDYDSKVMARSLNYYKVGIKCDIFSKLSNLSEFNYGCINFNKDTYLNQNPETRFNSNSTKFLYTTSDEIVSPYFMMGLKNDEINKNNYDNTDDEVIVEEENNSFIVETLIAPTNIKGMFDGQEVIIPTQILTDNNSNLLKNVATTSEKIKLLKEYQAIINQYNLQSRINIYGDYLSLLMSQDREKVKTK